MHPQVSHAKAKAELVFSPPQERFELFSVCVRNISSLHPQYGLKLLPNFNKTWRKVIAFVNFYENCWPGKLNPQITAPRQAVLSLCLLKMAAPSHPKSHICNSVAALLSRPRDDTRRHPPHFEEEAQAIKEAKPIIYMKKPRIF